MEAIEARQAATLQYIAQRDGAFDLTAVAPAITAAIAYIDSRWQELPADRLNCLMTRWWHRDQYRGVTFGIRGIIGLVAVARRLVRTVSDAPDACKELVAVRAHAAAILDDAVLSQLEACRTDGADLPVAAAKLDASMRKAGPTRDRMRAWLDALALLDALRSMSRPPPGFRYPVIKDESGSPHLRITGVFHPLVQAPVAADVAWEGGERVLFITGPNMAGKTTLMRAVALAVHLAHVGMAVPGEAVLSLFDRLFAAMHVRDSIQRGESFFLAEIRRIGVLATALEQGERTFAVVDEAFKGTNVSDARDATLLLVRGLAGCAASRFIVASHLTEAADALDTETAVRLLQMTAVQDGTAMALRLSASARRIPHPSWSCTPRA